MIKSMTGFGKAIWAYGNKTGAVEIRTLNSKQLDMNIRMPSLYREKEADVRLISSALLERGKIDVIITTDNNGDTQSVKINKELALQYHKELKSLAETLGEQSNNLLSLVVKMPEVIGSSREQLQPEEWQVIELALKQAAEATNAFRQQEGGILEQDIAKRVQLIMSLLEQVKPYEEERMHNIRKQLNNALESALDKQQINRDRFEQELIYYLEKIDITEEKVRLHKHCMYFLQTMKEDAAGKKLGFITQEIGREINTLGSKANEANMQTIVVQMKDELEKIKEQLLNIL